MPSFDIDVDEFVWACSKYDTKKLIEALVEKEDLPNWLLDEKKEIRKDVGRKTSSEIDFSEKLDKLKTKYFSLTSEEEECLNKIFNKYL
jgi:hypothetical protein